jgi:hypothetical protein
VALTSAATLVNDVEALFEKIITTTLPLSLLLRFGSAFLYVNGVVIT